MAVRRPIAEELQGIGRSYGFSFSTEELSELRAIGDEMLASCDRLDELHAPMLPVKYPRDAGRAPTSEENHPHNAWAWRCSVKGASGGRLAGRTIALKDNICLAGMPLRNGSAVLEGFIPNEDATVVSRILDEGAEITGKAVCENFCLSGGSHTCVGAPVKNPHSPAYSAGGSSSGSAALVAAGAVDMALGCDQGGSIRMPSAWCGVVGLKPTHGLVPYTGIFPIEATLDHCGPITKTVADAALLLEVLAGEDGLDSRQIGVQTAPYTQALNGDVAGMRVSIVREGFGWEGVSEELVDETVRGAAKSMSGLGAHISEISIPFHRDGIHLWNTVALEGATMHMVRSDVAGWTLGGHYSLGMVDFYGRARRARGNDFPATVKLVVMLGQYLLRLA